MKAPITPELLRAMGGLEIEPGRFVFYSSGPHVFEFYRVYDSGGEYEWNFKVEGHYFVPVEDIGEAFGVVAREAFEMGEESLRRQFKKLLGIS